MRRHTKLVEFELDPTVDLWFSTNEIKFRNINTGKNSIAQISKEKYKVR